METIYAATTAFWLKTAGDALALVRQLKERNLKPDRETSEYVLASGAAARLEMLYDAMLDRFTAPVEVERFAPAADPAPLPLAAE